MLDILIGLILIVIGIGIIDLLFVDIIKFALISICAFLLFDWGTQFGIFQYLIDLCIVGGVIWYYFGDILFPGGQPDDESLRGISPDELECGHYIPGGVLKR